MKMRLIILIGLGLAAFSVFGQSEGDWNAYKAANGIPSSWTYDYWKDHKNELSAPAPAATFSPQQQMILNAGQAAMPALQQWSHDLFWGSPEEQARQQAAQQAQQQRQLAAQQLNNSGIYLLKQKDYLGAINEFQKALAQTPNAPNILQNLALAKQKIKDAAVAVKNASALGQLLGSQTAQPSTIAPNKSPLSLVNLDSSVVDFRTKNTPENSQNLGWDTAKVDLRGPSPGQIQQNQQQQIRELVKALGGENSALKTIYEDPDTSINKQTALKALDDMKDTVQHTENAVQLKDQLNNLLNPNFDGQAHN